MSSITDETTVGISNSTLVEPSSNPFPGLRPFDVWENYLFFGRDRQVDALLHKLSDHHFVAVVGTSGSGKSSLVRAGFLPALYGGFMVSAGSTWHVAVMRPGSSPIHNLAAALSEPDVFGDALSSGDADSEIQNRASVLESSSLGLVQLVRQAELAEGENLLLVVDQFEELFRFKQSKSHADAANEATAFVKLLLEAVHQRQLSIYVLLTLRSDFLGDCAQFRDLPEAINEGHYLIPRLLREQQREVILGPVAVGGAKISPRLVQQLLNDLGDNPDQLPILQHALMRTWDEWERDRAAGEPLDLRHYEAIGRMSHALSEHADEAFNELPDERARKICEAVFKCLTIRGADNRGIRRPTRLSEICAIAEAPLDEVVAVVEYFRRPGRSFIMPPHPLPLLAETVLDISHESLMRVWGRLVRWVEEEAESAQMYLRLAASSELYANDRAGLWRDPELQQALNWRDEQQPNEQWARRYADPFRASMIFLSDSMNLREHERLEKRRRQRLLNAAALAFLAFAAVLTGWALTERSSAARNAARAVGQELIAVREQKNAEQSAQLATQQKQSALQASSEAEAEKKVAEEQRAAALVEKQGADEARSQAVASSKAANEQRALAERSTQAALLQSHLADSMKQLSENAAQAVSRLRLLSISKALAIKASRMTDYALQGSASSSSEHELAALLAIQAWRFNHENGGSTMDPDVFSALHAVNRLLNPAALRLEGPHHSGVHTVAYRSDGRLFSASTDGTIAEWNRGTPSILASAPGIRTLAVSPDGKWLCAAGATQWLHLISLFGDGNHVTFHRPRAAVLAAHFIGNDRIALLGNDGTISIINREDGGNTTTLHVAGVIKAFAVNSNAGILVAGDAHGEIWKWPLDSLSGQPSPVDNVHAAISSLEMSVDGRRIAIGTERGMLEIWRGSRMESASTNSMPIRAITFSHDGGMLATASSDGNVRLWNPNHLGEIPITISDNPVNAGWLWAWTLDFSPDNATLAFGTSEGSIHLIALNPESMVHQIRPKLTRNLTRKEWDEYIGSDVPYAQTIMETVNQ